MTTTTNVTCDWTEPGHGFGHGSLEEARACAQAEMERERIAAALAPSPRDLALTADWAAWRAAYIPGGE